MSENIGVENIGVRAIIGVETALEQLWNMGFRAVGNSWEY